MTKIPVALTTRRTFEAAHWLPKVGPSHKCRRVHGHHYTVEVAIVADVDPDGDGMAIDYAEIDASIDACVISVCDHRLLNEISGLDNPTGENIAIWIMRQLKATTVLPLDRVTVWETPAYSATVYASSL